MLKFVVAFTVVLLLFGLRKAELSLGNWDSNAKCQLWNLPASILTLRRSFTTICEVGVMLAMPAAQGVLRLTCDDCVK